jgi:hypothetical protein
VAASRPLALALATFAAGLGAGWLLWHRTTSDVVDPFLATKKGPLAPPSLRGATPAPEDPASPVADKSPRHAGEEAGVEHAVAYPYLEVRVVDSQGEPVNAEVYGLPAGAKGDDDGDDVARAEFEGADAARIWFPRPGTYDVGAVSGPAHGLATDVAVPATQPLVLRIPETAAVDVAIDADVVDAVGGSTLRLRFEPRHEGPTRAWPGRGEALRGLSQGHSLSESGTVTLLAGVKHDVTVASPQRDQVFRVEPAEVVPPASVRVSVSGRRVYLNLRVTPSFVPSARTRLALDFRAGDAVVDREEWIFAPGESAEGLAGTVDVPPRTDTIRWQGVGVAPGDAPIRVSPDGRAVVEGTVSLNGALPTLPDLPPRPSVAVEGPPGEVATMRVHAVWSDDSDWITSSWDPSAGRGTAKRGDRDGGTLFAYGHARDGEDRARFVSLPRSEADPISLVRGGFAVVAPAVLPPPGTSYRIARADGHPFVLEDLTPGPVAAPAGAIVGPLEPGTIRFRVFLAGVEVGEASVVVRSDAYAPLVLRPSAERPAR